MKTFESVIYIGEPILTRGDYGESVRCGRMSPDGEVFVWDSTFGWSSWGSFDSRIWSLTGAKVQSVERMY